MPSLQKMFDKNFQSFFFKIFNHFSKFLNKIFNHSSQSFSVHGGTPKWQLVAEEN
jgi:hypothetical protein